jgi:multidrug transporter EmrE-like cation transporter
MNTYIFLGGAIVAEVIGTTFMGSVPAEGEMTP